jgi:hypothetical protein
MKRFVLAGATLLIALAAILPGQHRAAEQQVARPDPAPPAITRPPSQSEETNQGFLYGRVATDDGTTYEGRLRFGGDEEAFWGDYFNGFKDDNPWAAYTPLARQTQKRSVTLFGFEIPLGERPANVGRPFMARFGDIVRIEARASDVRVTLKSGTVFDLDRFSASDFDDGVRVWDARRGVVDLESWAGGLPPPKRLRVRSIEFLSTARLGDVPGRLHGTVRTRQGNFSGFVQWNRQQCVGTDELAGRSAAGKLRLRFDSIRSIERRPGDGAAVTLLDGREIALPLDSGDRGIYVDDARYGRVLVSWDVLERLDFSAGGSGPAYDDFPTGGPLVGSVTTRDRRRLTGRLVIDLDESEITETLDAPSEGVDYNIPFGLVASITPAAADQHGVTRATVRLHGGEELRLERAGDLGAGNPGVLVFFDGPERPEYVEWTDIERVEFDRPRPTYPARR